MKHLLYKISLSVGLILCGSVVSRLSAQQPISLQKKLLVRDSLDFKQTNTGFNTISNEFNPIPFKDGFLFVSNKKTDVNKYGFNKVYWIPKTLIGNKDSLSKSFRLNDDFTAPTSNDNNILYRYNRKKVRAANNTIENKFAEFVPEESFTIDDSASYIVYPQLSRRKINGDYKWELWEAKLVDGNVRDPQKIVIKDSSANYLHPYLSKDQGKLYFSSNRSGGKGGYDIYVLDRVNGFWLASPLSLDCVNTASDEINPTLNGNDLLFSSNRVGGMGGFDLYKASLQTGLKNCDIANLGYPINTDLDNNKAIQFNNEYYLSSTNANKMDIAAVQYTPVTIPVTGQVVYLNDLSLSPNQLLKVYDNDTQKLVDTIYTDINANYLFNAKPNRNYSIRSKNADGIEESLAFTTTDKIVPSLFFAANLKGRSPQQIKDSTEKVWAEIEQKRQDSIAAVSLESKFIVYYGFDKSVLTAKEKLVLDSLYNKLQKMPSTYLIVGAFTDCIGSFKYNYTLSVKRAQYVVSYLKKKGIPSSRFVSNGYSKNYTITPCSASLNKKAQQSNRRAEIVLSNVGNTNWENLEKERGKQYYTVYNSNSSAKPIQIAKDSAVTINPVLKKIVQPDTINTKKSAVLATKDGPSIIKSLVLEQDKKVVTNNNKPTEIKTNSVKKTDTVASNKAIAQKTTKPIVKEDPKLVVEPSTYVDDEISKAEILKALDSLATLKKEQERIVEYLTKRINKKPIDIFVNSDSVSIEIYDNAIHDKDSVSIIFNNRIIVDKQELKVNKPIRFKLKVDKNKKFNELIMVAENLGAEPPNTAVMFVTEKNGRKQQVMLSTDMKHNEVIYFIRIGKE